MSSHIKIFNHFVPTSLLSLSLVEFILLLVSFSVGHYVRFNAEGWVPTTEGQFVIGSIVFALVLLACTIAMGVYETGFREGLSSLLVRSVVSYFLLGTASLTLIYYVFPEFIAGRGVLAYAIICATILTVPVRWLFFKIVDGQSIRTRTLVLGVGKRAAALQAKMEDSHIGLADLVGFVKTSESEAIEVRGDIIEKDRPLMEIVKQYKVREIVVAIDERRMSGGGQFPLNELFECKLQGRRIFNAVFFYERELSIIELSEIQPSWMVFSTGFTRHFFVDFLKRFIDLTVAIVLSLVTWPLMLLATVAIFLESGRPIIYRQIRTGEKGEPFFIYKFRSMTVNAEKDGKAQWAQKNDARVTAVGAFLRNTRIDELPQLYNVLKGDMSIVGPRPERPEFVENLVKEIPYYNERHRVKPGLMGWAQLNYPYGASAEDAAQKLRYDLYYVKNRSIVLDLIIMVQTIQVILLGTGVR